MKQKSSADYQRTFRTRMREQGLVKKEVWIDPVYAERLTQIEKQFRQEGSEEQQDYRLWDASSLFKALKQEDKFKNGSASIEVIGGISPALYIVMHEQRDVTMFVTISGNQIVVESTLCAKDQIKDINRFNEAILRTHKYFPLSTVGLESDIDGKDFYFMFGALSASSILHNALLEIEVLANNVMQATEAFADFFSFDAGMQT